MEVLAVFHLRFLNSFPWTRGPGFQHFSQTPPGARQHHANRGRATFQPHGHLFRSHLLETDQAEDFGLAARQSAYRHPQAVGKLTGLGPT